MNRAMYLLIVIVAAAFLSTMTPAQALYVETPLKLQAAEKRVEVGDDVDFTIEPAPDNASASTQWAGKTVKIGYSYDPNERDRGDDPDAPVSDADYVEKNLTEAPLDEDSRGTFNWTIPAEVDGFNLNIHLEDTDGKRLGFAYLAVGDAPEVMRTTGGDPGGQTEPDLSENTEDTGAGDAEDDADTGEASGIALIGMLALVGAVLVSLNRRR